MIALVFALVPREARAFCVYNNTSTTIDATLVKGGTWSAKDIPAGGSSCCNWETGACTEAKRGVETTLQITFDNSNFYCKIAMQSDGYAHAIEKSRSEYLDERGTPLFPKDYPGEYSCVSRNYGDALRDFFPPGLDPTIPSGDRNVRFLATGDPQFKNNDTAAIGRGTAVLQEMVGKVGGSSQSPVRGVLIAGDLTMQTQKQEYDAYFAAISDKRGFVYDGVGNHDYYYAEKQEDKIAACSLELPGCIDPKRILDEISQRDRSTATTSMGGEGYVDWSGDVSDMHYSWDWQDVHFVQLNLFVGDTRAGGWNLDPYKSYSFLKKDLETYVGRSGRPVVLIHHYPPDTEQSKGDWETPYWDLIAPYNVVAVIVGHDHLNWDNDWSRSWDKPANATHDRDPIPYFVAGSAFDDDTSQGFATDDGIVAYLDFTIGPDTIYVERWKTPGGKVSSETFPLRSDRLGTVTVGTGPVGTWRPTAYCPIGMKANSFALRVEPNQGTSKDDSALNSVKLQCEDVGAVSHPGYWGNWISASSCPSGGYLTGAQIRIEKDQGDGDDSGANDVAFYCSGGQKLTVAGAGAWGDWGPKVSCPANTMVCGISVQMEDPLPADGDDSAMNGLRLQCCEPPPSTLTVGTGPFGGWEPVAMCPDWTLANGFSIRVEPAMGTSNDDSALNSLKLSCNGKELLSHPGYWGEWTSTKTGSGTTASKLSCASGHVITGAKMRIEKSQGSGDDTGANDVRFTCSDGKELYASNAGQWGDWGSVVSCPANTAVCGYQLQMQSSGNDDETAMNGLRLQCCDKRLRSSLITLPGKFGTWREPSLCPDGTWAVGATLRVEASQGSGDDTALNAVKLTCASADGTATTDIVSHGGYWGTWGEKKTCPTGQVITGMKVRSEAYQGSTTDDSAANDVKFMCSGGGELTSSNGGQWGDWSAGYTSCPSGQAVCGLTVQTERYQGEGAEYDDSAMNGLGLRCCPR